MNDHNKYDDPEMTVICPYNAAHTPTLKRFDIHLTKCRKQYPELASELKQCHFNFQHRIPRPEFEYHLETCSERLSLHSAQFQVDGAENPEVTKLMENVTAKLNIKSNDCWDDEVNPPNQHPLEQAQKVAAERGLLKNHSNEPPAVLKAKRKEDQMRYRDRMEKDEKAKLNLQSSMSSGRSVYDDRSSVSSFETARTKGESESDISFKTAVDATTNRLQEFQLVSRKNRGRGRPKSPVSRVQAGLGRGRSGIQQQP